MKAIILALAVIVSNMAFGQLEDFTDRDLETRLDGDKYFQREEGRFVYTWLDDFDNRLTKCYVLSLKYDSTNMDLVLDEFISQSEDILSSIDVSSDFIKKSEIEYVLNDNDILSRVNNIDINDYYTGDWSYGTLKAVSVSVTNSIIYMHIYYY